MTQPSEKAFRKACEEAGVRLCEVGPFAPNHALRRAVHALARRIDAEAVPVAAPALMDLATASLIEARNALKQHWIDWDGEPEDGWALRLAWAKCDQTISILAENSFDEVQSTAAPQPKAAQKWQHVAYFDEGQFHWMSGIRPRDCELYAAPPKEPMT